MNYLLDTDHISILLRRKSIEHERLLSRLNECTADEIAFRSVSLHEQFMGCHSLIARNRAPTIVRGYQLLLGLLSLYCAANVLSFDAASQRRFDSLKLQKVRLKTMDLRLAATAVEEGLVLLTRNTVDFGRVPGLVTEDWTQP
jgi:tRNA(fMet)-specific endonuclease VapC